jgi:hypothetical protein
VLLALLALDLLVAAHADLWREYDSHPYPVRLGESRRPWDLVVVGASTVMCSADPAVLSGVCWHGAPLDRVDNLGLVCATASEISLAVEHGCRPAPRLLVYGVSASDYNDDRREGGGPTYLMGPGDAARWLRDRPDSAAWLARHYARDGLEGAWRLYAHRTGIRLWAADVGERCCPGLCPGAAAEARARRARARALHAAHGFQSAPAGPATRLDCLKAAGQFGPAAPFHFLENYRLGPYFKCLDRLLDGAARRGRSVVLVDLPVPADLDEGRYRQEFALYRRELADRARAHGTPLLHATRGVVGVGDAEFADQIHLNARGAARFSAWLRRQLEQL